MFLPKSPFMKSQLKSLCFLVTIALVSCQTDQSQSTPNEVEVLVANLYGGTGGLSVDKQGNIYNSDFGPFLGRVPNLISANKIFKITPEGEVSIFADSLSGASGSDFDEEGNLFQSNIRAGVVSKISADGRKTEYAKDSLFAPVGVIVNKDKSLIVCNCGTGSLRKITPEGESIRFAQSELLKCPNGITMDDNGNYYVSNFYDSAVVKVTPAGEASIFAKIPGNNNGHIKYWNGNLFVVARANHQIYKVSMGGEVTLFAGSGKRGRKDGSRLEASFNFPNDLDFSPDGKYMYVNEEGDTLSNHQILTPSVVRRIRME